MAKDNNVFEDPNVLVFVPQASLDQLLVREHLERLGPQVLKDERLIDTAEVSAFAPQQVIICAFRHPAKPVTGSSRDEDNKIVTVMRPHVELMSEVVFCKPVTVGEHWRKTGGMRAGTLDVSALISALNASSSPYRVYWRDPASPKPQTLGLTLV